MPFLGLELDLERVVVLVSTPFSRIDSAPLRIRPSRLNRAARRIGIVSKNCLLNTNGSISDVSDVERHAGRDLVLYREVPLLRIGAPQLRRRRDDIRRRAGVGDETE